jgi:hypothetical protein
VFIGYECSGLDVFIGYECSGLDVFIGYVCSGLDVFIGYECSRLDVFIGYVCSGLDVFIDYVCSGLDVFIGYVCSGLDVFRVPVQRSNQQFYDRLAGKLWPVHYVQRLLCCSFVFFVFVLCTIWCQFLWIFHFLFPLRYS